MGIARLLAASLLSAAALLAACTGRVGFDSTSAGNLATGPLRLERAEARNGATSIDLILVANKSSIAYSRARLAPWPNPTTETLRDTVLADVLDGDDLAFETTTLTAQSVATTLIDQLPEQARVYLYVAPVGDDGELAATVTELTVDLPERMPVLSFASSSQPSATTHAYVYLPEDHYKTTDSFPLLIFLHGWGEKATADGTDQLALVLTHGIPDLLAAGSELPFIAVSPQCNDVHWDCWSWTPALTDELIEEARARYRVDDTRIYLTGLSTGAGGTYNYAMAYPDRLAAILPIATIPVGTTNIDALVGLPVWDFHCRDDSLQPYTNSTAVLTALTDAIATATGVGPFPAPLYTEYPPDHPFCTGSTRHNAWTTTYEQTSAPYPTTVWFDGSASPTPTDVYAWLLSHRRP